MARGKQKPRLRGVVWAAQDGEGLRPLAAAVPAPLLPFGGTTALRWALEGLARCGCEATVVLVDRHAERLERAHGERFEQMALHYVQVAAEPGPFAALCQQREFLSAADAAVWVPTDRVCRWPLRRLASRLAKSGAPAAVLLVPRGGERVSVVLAERGRVAEPRAGAGAAEQTRGVAGAWAFSRALLDRFAAEFGLPGSGGANFDSPLIRRLLAEHQALVGVTTRARWHDVTQPWRYLNAALDLARGRHPGRLFRRRAISRSAVLERGAAARASVIEHGARLGRRASVVRSVVLAGAQVGAQSRVVDSVIAPEVVLPPGTNVQRRMVTALKSGRDPRAGDSVVGQLVFTPIERRTV